jgi:hypothetical protein
MTELQHLSLKKLTNEGAVPTMRILKRKGQQRNVASLRSDKKATSLSLLLKNFIVGTAPS